MKKIILISLALLIILISFSQKSASRQQQFLEWIIKNAEEKNIVLNLTTIDTSTIKPLLKQKKIDFSNPKIQQQIIEQKISFDTQFSTNHTFVDSSSISKVSSYLRLSVPLFVGNEVWIKSELFCGALCGAGYIQVYKKQGKKYILVDSILIWNS